LKPERLDFGHNEKQSRGLEVDKKRRKIIPVELMDEIQVVALFKRKMGGQSERKDAAQLVAVLEFMPLAIVQATAYIKQRAPRCSVHKVHGEVREERGRKDNSLELRSGTTPPGLWKEAEKLVV
jgi:hypothetical protein